MDGKRFIEIRKLPVEEVREIESEISLETPTVEKGEVCIVKSSPEDQKEGAKDIVGGVIGTATVVEPELGVIAGGVSKGVGKAAEGIGKAIDNKDLKDAGEIYSEGADKPIEKAGEKLEDMGDKIEEGVDKIKGIFD